MTNYRKKHLFSMIILSVLLLAGCANANKLIVPDGTQRVLINREAATSGASIHQGIITKHDKAA